jgi:hypothetical protein
VLSPITGVPNWKQLDMTKDGIMLKLESYQGGFIYNKVDIDSGMGKTLMYHLLMDVYSGTVV